MTIGDKFLRESLLGFQIKTLNETSSETQFGLIRENYFRPNTFIDITSHLDEKIKILKHYKSEIQEHPFPRSEETIKALARWRGANAGFHYAEAFEVLFEKQ